MGAKGKQAPSTAAVAAPAENPWRRFTRWSGMDDPEADARLDDEVETDAASRGPTWLPFALLIGLYALAVLVYYLLGRGQVLPQVAPDEYQYTALARSVADGNGLTYNGGPIPGGLKAALYIYSIAPAWMVTDSLTQSYAIAKAMSAFMVCSVVFPTWLLARRYMPPLVALIPAALMVAGSWMTSSGQLILENMGLPLAAASLAALVVALARPGSRWVWVSLIFAFFAAWSRAQLLVLVPIILLSVIVDIAAQGRTGWRTRVHNHRWLLGLSAAITVIGGIAVLSKPRLLGSYMELQANSDFGAGVPLIGRLSLAYIAMSAVLPFVLALAISLRRRAWDESRLRSLLIVLWVATLTLVVVSGVLTTAFKGVDWGIQRYVEYSLPLLYVLVIAGIWQRLIAVRLLALITGLVALGLLLTPRIQNIQEQRGTFGLVRRLDQALGVSPGLAMALVAVVLGGILLLVLTRTRATRTAVLTTFLVLTGLVFVVQNQAGWDWQREQSQVWRNGFPEDLSWIDNATDRDLARLVTYYNPFRTPQTEFFNRRITRTYVNPAQPAGGAQVTGYTCPWSISGGVVETDPKCGPTPTAFFLNDDQAKITFYDQQVVAQKKDIGRVVTVSTKPPEKVRVKAVINPPCLAPIQTQIPETGEITPPQLSCLPLTAGTVYLDDPGTVVLRFRGGQQDAQVQVNTVWKPNAPEVVDIPARDVTDIKLDVPAGEQSWRINFGWQGSPPAVPALTSVKLTQDGTQTELLY